MYLGKIVELAATDSLFASPLHPYTQALLGSVPKPSWSGDSDVEAVSLSGDVPSPINPPRGCYFSTRCPRVMPRCREAQPALVEAAAGPQGRLLPGQRRGEHGMRSGAVA